MGLEHFLARTLDAIHRLALATAGGVAVGKNGLAELPALYEQIGDGRGGCGGAVRGMRDSGWGTECHGHGECRCGKWVESHRECHQKG